MHSSAAVLEEEDAEGFQREVEGVRRRAAELIHEEEAARAISHYMRMPVSL